MSADGEPDAEPDAEEIIGEVEAAQTEARQRQAGLDYERIQRVRAIRQREPE